MIRVPARDLVPGDVVVDLLVKGTVSNVETARPQVIRLELVDGIEITRITALAAYAFLTEREEA